RSGVSQIPVPKLDCATQSRLSNSHPLTGSPAENRRMVMSDARKIRSRAVDEYPFVRKRIARALLFSTLLVSCGQPPREPVTLRYPHGWRFEPDEISKRATLTQQFTQQTGIQIREMPQPESTFDQLDLFRKLLKPGTSGIDLLGVDLIWSATLESDLVDLA